ncbi:MAG: murein tripeptide amidase MpaA [Gemmatimonadetes bacterium]|nr:murein tripeptide amidase MpaA [Gemmatimonadota bacterium]
MTAKLRARADWGTISWTPSTYGRSIFGLPLEVWRPEGECRLLVFAGIHGEEPETTYALSRALRQLTAPPKGCAVVLAANPDGLVRGTRANARGVDLNRNFPAKNWTPAPVTCRSTLEDPSDIVLSPGTHPASEPEVEALLALIDELRPRAVVALHAPLACIDDPGDTALGRWLAQRTGMPLVRDVGYPTPGSFGSWGKEHGVPIVTYEFPLAATEVLMRDHVPVLVELLLQPDR